MTEENITYYEARKKSFLMVPETCPLILAAERDLADIFTNHLRRVYKGELPPDFRMDLLYSMDELFTSLKKDTTIKLRTALIEVITENMQLQAKLDHPIVNDNKKPSRKQIPPLSIIFTFIWAALAVALQFAVSILLLPINLMFWAFDRWETRHETT